MVARSFSLIVGLALAVLALLPGRVRAADSLSYLAPAAVTSLISACSDLGSGLTFDTAESAADACAEAQFADPANQWGSGPVYNQWWGGWTWSSPSSVYRAGQFTNVHGNLFVISLTCPNGGVLGSDYPGWCIVNGQPPPVTPPPVDCAAKAATGKPFSFFLNESDSDAAWSSDSHAAVYEGCGVTVQQFGMCAPNQPDSGITGDTVCVVWGTYTGEAADSGPAAASESETGQCVQAQGGGDQLCQPQEAPPDADPGPDQQCGTVNGQPVCVSQIPDDTCVQTSGGGMLCVASGPPLPQDSGGTPIVPDATLHGDDGTGSSGGDTYNYYSSGSVAGSSNYGSGAPDTTTTTTCDESGTCTTTTKEETTDRADGAFPLSDTVGQSLAKFKSTIEGAPIVAGAAGIGASFDRVAACPDTSFTIFDRDFNFDVVCQLYDNVAPVLSVVFLAIWSILGIRVVLSA